MPRVQIFKPFSSKCKRSEILVDHIKQILGLFVVKFSLRQIKFPHVVADISRVVVDVALSCRAKCLDSELLTFLHLCLVVSLHDWHRFACVDAVRLDTMAAKILDALNLVCLSFDRTLVRLHCFLNGFTDLAKSCVDSSHSDTRFRSFFDGSHQFVVLGIDGPSEGTVSYYAAHMRSKVNLHNIILAQYGCIADVRSPMSRTRVNTGSCWEGNTTVKAISLD